MSRSFLAALALTSLVGTAHADDRPNIVLILSDDMGFSDIGCYGGEIETPHLDGLAEDGLRLTQFYNTGRCCPTRASLLTGLYPHAAGIGHMQVDRGHPGYTGDLNDRCRTIAQVLQSAGYATAMSGKWHVTKNVAPETAKFNWPLQRGFDRYYGIISGAASFWDPWSLTRDNTRISAFADPGYNPATDSPAGAPYYFTDAVSDHAVRAIEASADDDKPLFLYVAYTAAHWPMHARPRDIAKYEGRYDAGYAATRQARFERMKRLGLLDDDAELSPRAEDWSVLAGDEAAWNADLMEIYAAMVDSMDQGIGRIVASLDATGQLDNTLILYCQDNGGCAEGMGRKPAPPKKTAANTKSRYGKSRAIVGGPAPERPIYEPLPDSAFIGAMIPPQTRDGYPIRGGINATSGGADTYIAYGRGWANVSNTPFREYKHYVHEGGISTPLIAHWPAGIKRAGQLDASPSHLVDIMATCVDVAGADYAASSGRNNAESDDGTLHPMAGVSLMPVFTADGLEPRQLYWEHEGNRAIRDGDWKLVAKERQPWELYNIRHDRSELHNVIDEQPDLAAKLQADWTAWADRDNVSPVGMWRGKAGYEKTYGDAEE